MTNKLARIVFFLLVLISATPNLLSAQSSRYTRQSWDQRIIEQHFKRYKPQTANDSAYYQAYQYLNYEFPRDTSNLSFSNFTKLVLSNRPATELYWFNKFYDTVRINWNKHATFMADLRMQFHLLKMLDTLDISSADSLFEDVLAIIADEEQINYDSLIRNTRTIYSEDLVKAIKMNIDKVKKSNIFSQIRTLRRDTSNFYLVNVKGDSMPIRMYKNNPHVVRTYITDMMGGEEPVIIRDIHRNSFRLIINESPERTDNNVDITKQVFGEMLASNTNRTLLRDHRQPPPETNFWRKGGKVMIDFAQIGQVHWVKGDKSSISLQTRVTLFANYKRGSHEWNNDGDFKYGAIHQKDKGLRTNNDLIRITSNYGYKAFSKFYYSAQGEFKSQFGPIYQYDGENHRTALLTQFFAPAWLTFGAGMEYKRSKDFTIFVSPLTSKNTFVISDQNKKFHVNKSTYNIEENKSVRSETGMKIKCFHKTKILDNVTISNTLELFSNYFNNPQNIDVDWNFESTIPINEYLQAMFSFEAIYDDDIDVPTNKTDENGKVITTKGTQIKEQLKLGFVFKF